MNDTNETRAGRLSRLIDENKLLRNEWVGGHERACLLAALSPEVADYARKGCFDPSLACPAELMPRWFARLTPHMDDNGSEAAWPAMVRRFASLAHRWSVLDAAAWDRVQARAFDYVRNRAVELGNPERVGLLLNAASVDPAALPHAVEQLAAAASCTAQYNRYESAWDAFNDAVLDTIDAECTTAERAASDGPGISVEHVLGVPVEQALEQVVELVEVSR